MVLPYLRTVVLALMVVLSAPAWADGPYTRSVARGTVGAGGGSAVGGTGSANQVTFWLNTTTITGDSKMTYTSANGLLTISGSAAGISLSTPGGNNLQQWCRTSGAPGCWALSLNAGDLTLVSQSTVPGWRMGTTGMFLGTNAANSNGASATLHVSGTAKIATTGAKPNCATGTSASLVWFDTFKTFGMCDGTSVTYILLTSTTTRVTPSTP